MECASPQKVFCITVPPKKNSCITLWYTLNENLVLTKQKKTSPECWVQCWFSNFINKCSFWHLCWEFLKSDPSTQCLPLELPTRKFHGWEIGFDSNSTVLLNRVLLTAGPSMGRNAVSEWRPPEMAGLPRCTWIWSEGVLWAFEVWAAGLQEIQPPDPASIASLAISTPSSKRSCLFLSLKFCENVMK